jgi:phosphoribosylformylglycinamidine synthase
MKKVISLLYSPGTNCEEETMEAFKLAGGKPKLVFLADILKGKKKITDCDIFCVPGGFSFGDHIDTGIIVATLMRDFFPQLLEAKIPTIGICNGFQILMRAGMFGKGITLTRNKSGVFCSMPVQHLFWKSNCIWTRGLEETLLSFPSAHIGGFLESRRDPTPQVAMVYSSESPNGGSIAGIFSNDGLVFGLMDHPERPYGNLDGQKIFRNGISY